MAFLLERAFVSLIRLRRRCSSIDHRNWTRGRCAISSLARSRGAHGEKGVGKPNDPLVGGRGTLTRDQVPIKTVGSFWPYATTIFDYVRRSMPLNESKSLTNDEVYAVVAYILQLNGIIGEDTILDAQTLPKVRMPNRDGFDTFTRGK
jgi:S-disulfanyl-L-cysteine oxidoreductase SoxD